MNPRLKIGTRPWYETSFQADYLERYCHRSDRAARQELPFLREKLGLPTGTCVLDLCCGAGRHSRALARAGLRVTGMDLSADLINSARSASDQGHARGKTRYVRGDMRRLPFHSACFDGAVNLFTSFGYFSSDAQDACALREVARVLKPGAAFIFDFLNFQPTLDALVASSESQCGDGHCRVKRWFDPHTRRFKKITRIGSTGTEGTRIRRESVRGYTFEELEGLFKQAGLRVIAKFGDLQGARYNARRSPRCVLVARKKGLLAVGC